MVEVAIGLISLLLVGAGLSYFLATMGAGLREIRRQKRNPPVTTAELVAAGTPRPSPATVYFLVPCLNEEAVIGSTVSALLTHPNARVVVIDDGSDDGTAAVVSSFSADNVLLVSRTLPEAREGKGPALNFGYRAVVADARARSLDPARVLVCVMDADGQLSDAAFDHVLPLFDDPLVGGVQLGVRIVNRRRNLLTRMQDFEFWGISATSQMGRIRSGTVSLGGNGQFTRLSALLALGPTPWSAVLTEDLDLAITLMLEGWKLTSTPAAWVHQQGIGSVRKLIRQRTRWFQGHMSCAGRLRQLWKCSTLSNLALLEVSVYLLIPWMFVLPWSILFHVAVWQMVANIAGLSAGSGDTYARVALVGTLAFWYVTAFGPSIFAGYIYHRHEDGLGRTKAFALGHVLVLYNYIAFLSCWSATFRNLRGHTAWEKTARRPEPGWQPTVVTVPATVAIRAPVPAPVPPVRVPARAPMPLPVPAVVRTGSGGARRLIVSGTVSLGPPRFSPAAAPVIVTGRFRPTSHPDVVPMARRQADARVPEGAGV